eukprot:3010783-Rhodomonas_salina.1
MMADASTLKRQRTLRYQCSEPSCVTSSFRCRNCISALNLLFQFSPTASSSTYMQMMMSCPAFFSLCMTKTVSS